MTFTDRQIVKPYATLFDGLTPDTKLKLIECLSKSLKSDIKKKEANLFKSFGGFAADKSAEETIKDVKSKRTLNTLISKSGHKKTHTSPWFS